MYFEIYQQGGALGGLLGAALSDQWRWRLKAANHEIIASGEGYTTKANCLHVIGLLKQTHANTPVHQL